MEIGFRKENKKVLEWKTLLSRPLEFRYNTDQSALYTPRGYLVVGNRVSLSICMSSPCELFFVHTFGINFPKGFSYINVQWQSLLF